MTNARHTQIRNVVFENADIGIILDGSSFVTIQNVTFNSARPPHPNHPYSGGKGIWMKVRVGARLCKCVCFAGSCMSW